jgi:signal transduction histidine kinase
MRAVQADADSEERDYYRREAMGAFAHEIRTPLTSLRMVVELARRQAGQDGGLVLDSELAAMLHESIGDLQQLADDLQEQSRLERGRVAPGAGPCDLPAAVAAAQELLPGSVEIVCAPVAAMTGPWDAARLVRAIAGFAESANRIGAGSGEVHLEASETPECVSLQFSSGEPGENGRQVAADAGFAFFWARQFVLALGGSVEVRRGERSAAIRVDLPLERRGM